MASTSTSRPGTAGAATPALGNGVTLLTALFIDTGDDPEQVSPLGRGRLEAAAPGLLRCSDRTARSVPAPPLREPIRCAAMRPYAERPVRAMGQVLADVLVIGWVVLVVRVAFAARDLVDALQGPGRTLSDAGGSIRDAFSGAADTAGGVPFVGDDLARALGNGTGAGESLVAAGREQVVAVAAAATGIAVGIVLIGAVPVVLLWLTLRIRWMRAAGSARKIRDVDTDLLALRALTRAPARSLLVVSPDPAAAWRRDDRDVVRGLAGLELASLGLRAPTHAPDRP